jgi:CAAX protease family protein
MPVPRAEQRRHIAVFVLTAYALSIMLSFVIGLTGGYRSKWIGLGYVSMVIPTVAVAIANAMSAGKPRVLEGRSFPLRYLPLALFLMPIAMHAVMLPTAAALGTLHWQDWLTKAADGLYHSPADRGWGALTTSDLVLRIALNAIVGVIVVSALALFEEIGWRAWLLPRLSDLMTRRKAIVLSSIIWALWHVPYALAGIQHLNGVPLVWTVFVVPVGVLGSGLVLGWFWMKTESLWILAIAHGALNDWGQYAFKFVGPGQTSDAVVLSSGSLALVTLGIILCWTRLRPAA